VPTIRKRNRTRVSEASPPSPLLLDTHIWIWELEGMAQRMAPTVQHRIQVAAETSNVYVSMISLWEVAMIVGKGRLHLSTDPLTWLLRALGEPGPYVVPISPEIAVESTRLPGTPHRDPADQLLIATARHTGATLVTSDRKIISYAQTTGALAVLDARR